MDADRQGLVPEGFGNVGDGVLGGRGGGRQGERRGQQRHGARGADGSDETHGYTSTESDFIMTGLPAGKP